MEDDSEYDSSVLVEGQGVDIIPELASSYRPVKGMMFSSIDQAFDFYCEYAKKAGFGACKDDFVEGHNHRMVADSDMQFVRSTKKLTHVQEEAIYELSNMNLGLVKAFNLMRTQGAKKTFSSDYSFVYDVNDDRELIRMFLADETSKSNYLAFGDIISFDVTFKNNKYTIVFVLFTAIDNHCHSVTVGAGLLASETIESYTWLLQMLLNSFGHAPKVVVTDQDPAMKQVIAAVFPNTRHRLCMWHIMKKVAEKVRADLCNNEDFKRRLCNIEWTDSISPLEFEEKWQAIMVEFELDKNKWLIDMYEIRFDWIPAFYRDELLSGLMRTTSRSESENHFFEKASNSQLTLVEFFNHFEFCMEIQIYNGRRCDHDSRYAYPQLETRSYLEREAVRIYTRAIFNDLQDEMKKIFVGVSQFSSCEEEGGFLRCKIIDFNAYVPGFLDVVFKKDGDFRVYCNMLLQKIRTIWFVVSA
ncbi:protein FAR-RED IMPAIRED RESPONSE 1-like [Bidens hawaiensis]|uniref:protein FAR-RED IMPAIRED RESPONSE 1-like n=1 Tax=Bidens hawaiensis TaxID=980011 RepID=UPI00404A77B9